MDEKNTMRAWFWMIIAVGLPALELVGIYLIGQKIGAWTLVWLVAAFFFGLWLLRREQLDFLPRLAQAMLAGHTPLAVLMGSARRLLAGLLFMFPGAGSDLLAFLLLLWPGGGRPRRPPPRSAADRDETVIEGEYRRLD
jgi:UPF0716 family protein affecting phage T7 exclusion